MNAPISRASGETSRSSATARRGWRRGFGRRALFRARPARASALDVDILLANLLAWLGTRFLFGVIGYLHSAKMASAFSSETPSWNASLHIMTGAVPQLARHSTNSTVYLPSPL